MRRAAVVVTSAALALSACSGSGHAASRAISGVSSVVSATEGAESARFETVFHSVERGLPGREPTNTTTTDGVIDFTDHLGSQTRTSKQLPAREFLWRDGVGYQQADASTISVDGAPKGTKWISTDSNVVAAAGGCVPYLLAPPTTALLGESPSAGIPSPDGLLDTLRAAGASLVRLGSDKVRGTATTHWRIDVSGVTTTTIPTRCRPNLDGVTTTSVPAELWTDAQNRLRRVVYTTTSKASNVLGGSFQSPPGPATVVETTTTELYDFGVRVHVSAPPADQVFDVTAVEAALLSGPGTVRAAGWSAAARGTFNGKAWTVWYARSSTNWRCYAVTGLPPSPDALPLPDSDIFPKRDGHASDCSPPHEFPPADGAFTAIVAGVDGNRWTLVGRVDDSAPDARVRFANGTSEKLSIDSDTRLVQWSGPVSPAPTEVTTGRVSCTLAAGVTSNDEECLGVVDPGSIASPGS